MTAEALYCRLIAAAVASPLDGFDRHVVAAILAVAAAEGLAAGQADLGTAAGLERAALERLSAAVFPSAAEILEGLWQAAPVRPEEEQSLLDLLIRCGTKGSSFEAVLAAMIARRAQSPNHLWQDLGLRDRGELSQLMARHFAPLARRNDRNMKWKKFLYRAICRDTGYSLCVAPSCAECDDFDNCFGAEEGESTLARIRRAGDRAVP